MKKKNADARGVRRKIEIIRRELLGEMDHGLAYVERQVGTITNGPISLFVSPLLRGLFHLTALPAARRRGYQRVDIYFQLLQERGNIDRLIARHLDKYLETNEAWVRAKKDHPLAPRLKDYLVDELKSHLELGRALLGGEGQTYDDLIRSAFPRRSGVQRLMNEQFDAMERALRIVQESEGLVDIPPSLRQHVDRLLRSALAYARTRSFHRLDRIYAG